MNQGVVQGLLVVDVNCYTHVTHCCHFGSHDLSKFPLTIHLSSNFLFRASSGTLHPVHLFSSCQVQEFKHLVYSHSGDYCCMWALMWKLQEQYLKCTYHSSSEISHRLTISQLPRTYSCLGPSPVSVLLEAHCTRAPEAVYETTLHTNLYPRLHALRVK